MFLSEDQAAANKKVLSDYLRCIEGNHDRFVALTRFSLVDASGIEDSCIRIPDIMRRRIMFDAMRLFLANKPINGEKDCWSNGCFGSQWMDLDLQRYPGFYSIRCAFYKNKPCDDARPYSIQIMAEKTA